MMRTPEKYATQYDTINSNNRSYSESAAFYDSRVRKWGGLIRHGGTYYGTFEIWKHFCVRRLFSWNKRNSSQLPPSKKTWSNTQKDGTGGKPGEFPKISHHRPLATMSAHHISINRTRTTFGDNPMKP